MKELLKSFDKETLIDFIVQRMGYRRTKQVQRDLLYIAWEKQSVRAQEIMNEACASMNRSKTEKQHLLARLEFEKGMVASKKADRIWERLESLDKEA